MWQSRCGLSLSLWQKTSIATSERRRTHSTDVEAAFMHQVTTTGHDPEQTVQLFQLSRFLGAGKHSGRPGTFRHSSLEKSMTGMVLSFAFFFCLANPFSTLNMRKCRVCVCVCLWHQVSYTLRLRSVWNLCIAFFPPLAFTNSSECGIAAGLWTTFTC